MRAGQALAAVLAEHQLNQSQLAQKIGLARSTVSQWANGSADPLSESIPLIADALDLLADGAGTDFLSRFLGRLLAPTAEDEYFIDDEYFLFEECARQTS